MMKVLTTRIAKITFLSILTLLVCGDMNPSTSSARPSSSDAELSSLVTIRRDKFGVPHILGQTEEAAAFGQGYATAEDHCLDMARLYLKARSEEAAYFGEMFAPLDMMTKRLHIYDVASDGYLKSPPWVQSILDGYAAGYDRYVEKHRSDLPEWVKPVTGIDVLAHTRRVTIMEFTMNLNQLGQIGQKAMQAAAVDPGNTEALAEGPGSNMWAIGKGRTAGGEGILLGNPHLAWAGSQIFHEVHLTVPGRINVSGTTLIGTPGVAIGFNEGLGWSHTVNLHDSDDIYELTLDPGDPHRYIYDGKSLPMQKEGISIQVKTDAGLVTKKEDLYQTHYGPVLKWLNGKGYAFKSADMYEYRMTEQWSLMGKARNLEEFRRALDMQALPMFNICYADREGNVFYIFNGRFPDRPAGYDWSGVVPGNTSATEWNRVLPESRLPYLVNPPGGYVQNSNSSPWYTNLHAIIDRRQYPADLTPTFNGLRTQLGLEMLENETSFTLEKVLKYKFNTKLMLADRVKWDLLHLARGRASQGIDLEEAARVLQAWDNTVSRSSRGSMLFVTFWNLYRRRAHPIYAVDWNEHYPASTPYGIGDEPAALQSLAEAAKEVKDKYGALDVAWGDVHRLRRGSLDVAIGGLTDEYGAFRVIGYATDKDGKYVAVGGDSYVLAVDFTGSGPRAYTVVAYSESDDSKSSHYNDQSRLFADEQWKPAWFTEEDIARNLERSYHP
jgi:acyl-homoserine-lactone acylase